MTTPQPPITATETDASRQRTEGEQLVHDLNNALMAAMGSLGMIQCTLPSGTAAAPHLATLDRAIQRISARVEAFGQELSAQRPQ